jgi:hypothetical protein
MSFSSRVTPRVLPPSELKARFGKPSAIRILDASGEKVYVALAALGSPEGVPNHLVELSECDPRRAMTLCGNGEVLFPGNWFSTEDPRYRGVIDIRPFEELPPPHGEPNSRRWPRLNILSRARQIKSFYLGKGEALEWPSELGPLLEAVKELRAARALPGAQSMPPGDAPSFERTAELANQAKVEQNAFLAVLSERLLDRVGPRLERAQKSLPRRLARRRLSDDDKYLLLIRRFNAVVRQQAQILLAERGPMRDRLKTLEELFSLLENEPIDLGRQFLGGATLAVETLVNVARVAATKFDEVAGRPPASVDELLDVLRRSKKLIGLMASGHQETLVVREALDRGDGLWDVELLRLVPEGKSYRVDFTSAAEERLTRKYNVWFNTPLDGTTGCPAAVNLGNGSSIHRLFQHVFEGARRVYESNLSPRQPAIARHLDRLRRWLWATPEPQTPPAVAPPSPARSQPG